MTEDRPSQPLRRIVDVLGLLAHGAAFLWIPLLVWGPGNHKTGDRPPKHQSPAQWSRLSLPAEVAPTGPSASRLQDLSPRERLAPFASAPIVNAPIAQARSGPDIAPVLSTLAGTRPIQEFSVTGDDPLSSLLLPLRGAAALGGDLTLADLNAKPVPVAVRAERLHWSRSKDPLTPLPRHWREEMRSAMQAEAKRIEAQVVRLPAPHLDKPEEVPLAINSKGDAWSLVQPASPPSRALVEQWASRQSPPPEGSGRAVVVTLEPIEPAPAPAAEAVSSLPPAPLSTEPETVPGES